MTCGVCLTSQLAEVAQAYHALLQMARLIWAVTKGDQKKTDWASVHKKLLKFKKNVEDLRKLPGAEIYYRRLYSIVSNRKGSRRIKKETVVDACLVESCNRMSFLQILLFFCFRNRIRISLPWPTALLMH